MHRINTFYRTSLILTVLVISATGVHAAETASGRYADVRRELESEIRKSGDQFGGAVLVAIKGEVVLSQAYGYANKEWEIAATPKTRYHLESVSKMITALTIMRLVERESLHLSDSICDYTDNCPAAWRRASITHLLSHTSGLPDFQGTPHRPEEYPELRVPVTTQEVIAYTRGKPIKFQPGEKISYNNLGFLLLGVVIEKVAGKSYAAVVKDEIFDRAGMSDSGFDPGDVPIARMANAYRFNEKSDTWSKPDAPTHLSWFQAAGSLYSTVEDMYKLDRALRSNRLLKRETLEAMLKPIEKGRMGLGWERLEYSDAQSQEVGYIGAIPGYGCTNFSRFPEDDVTVIVFTNYGGRGLEPLKRIALEAARSGDD